MSDNDNDYGSQLSLRGSDRAALMISRPEDDSPMISSDTWHGMSKTFETGEKIFEVAAGLAAATGHVEISGAAAGTAAIAKVAAEIAKRQAEEARAKERAAAERRAIDSAVREHVERFMKEHFEKVSRGEYFDPPSRERLNDIGRIA